MKGNNRILQDVTHVDHLPVPQHFWMFRLHEPAHVGEEEASMRVMRVGICLAELVVHSVVAHPIKYRILLASVVLQWN